MNSQALLDILVKMEGKKALVVGDLMLDRYIIGSANRVSDEAPVPVVKVSKIEERLGGASNVAANLAALGVKVSMLGVLGEDADAKRFAELLKQNSIDDSLLINDFARPTILKTRIIARNQQVVRVDWEELSPLSLELEKLLLERFAAAISGVDFIIVSDYGKGTLPPSFFEKVAELYSSGLVGLEKCPIVLDPHPANYANYKNFCIAKPNRREAEAASGIKIKNLDDAKLAADKIRLLWNLDVVLLSLGEDGLLISSKNINECMKTNARQVYDVSGAGDTVTAVFTAALSAGATLIQAGTLANIAAGIVVSEVGTVAVSKTKIINEVMSISSH